MYVEATKAAGYDRQQEPRTSFSKRIGSTTYEVAVYYSKTSKETMNDKILRLIKNEAPSGKVAGQ